MQGKIKLLFNVYHPASNSMKNEEVYWIAIPRKGEMVYYKDKSYTVDDVLHSIDLGIIKILLK